MMKKLKHIIISFIIVFIINYSFIFAFAYSREDVYKLIKDGKIKNVEVR